MKTNIEKFEQMLDRKMKSIHMNLVEKNGMQIVAKTTVSFIQENEVPPKKGSEESYKRRSGYPIWSTFQPHDDFQRAMLNLLPHALEALEMYVAKEEQKNYTVVGLDISGDLFMNQARVEMTIAKIVKRSEKIVKLCKTPQITLSEQGNYRDWKDLQKRVEKVIAEAWEYLKGKHKDDETPLTFQLDMFESKKDEPKGEKPVEKKEKGKRKIQPPEPGITGIDTPVMGSAGVA